MEENIASIPLLYKMFAKLLHNRLEPILDLQQCPDQAGFRRKYCTEDHLLTLTIIQEKAEEWQQYVWIAALDFKKAFDTVSHDSLWKALQDQEVPDGYVALLKSLYSDQVGNVKTDRLSKDFQIERGTKQGDPLSSLLFNCVLEDIMRKTKDLWAQRGYGLQIGFLDKTKINNLRFADDVLLISTSLPHITKMLKDMIVIARQYGLELHPDKTKILSNSTCRHGQAANSSITIDNMNIEILSVHDKTKYLGN